MRIRIKGENMFLKISVVFFLFILMFNLAACERQEENKAYKHIVLAESYLEVGQLKSALIESKNALNFEPGNVNALHIKGKTLLKLGRLEEAHKALASAKALAVNNTDVAFDFIKTLIKQEKTELALTELEKIFSAINASSYDIFYTLKGFSLLAINNNIEAKEAFYESLKNNNNYIEAYLGLAEYAFKIGNIEELNLALTEIERKDDINIQMFLWRGKLAFMAEKYADAEEFFSKALLQMNALDTVTPEKFLALNGIVKALIAQGKPEQAITFSQILENTPQGVFISKYKEGMASYLEGQLTQAEQTFQKLLKLNPNYAPTETVLGAIKYANGEFKEAENYLREAIKLDPKYQDAKKLLILTKLNLNQPQEARSALDEMLAKDPENTDLLTFSAIAYLRNKQNLEAEKNLEKALALSPDYGPALLIMGTLYGIEAKWKKALFYFEAVLKKQPDQLVALRGLYFAKSRLTSSQEAIKEIKAIANQHPRLINPHLVLVNIYLKEENIAQAKEDAMDLYLRHPNSMEVKKLLASVYDKSAELLMNKMLLLPAKKELEEALKLLPNEIKLEAMLASLLYKLNEKEASIQVIENIKKQQPNAHFGYELEGDLWAKENNSKKSVEAYQQAWHYAQNEILSLKYYEARLKNGEKPQDALGHILAWTNSSSDITADIALGNAYLSGGLKKEAVTHLEQSVLKYQNNATLLNNLAWAYFEAHDERAETTAENAVQLAPKDPYVLDTYAWILFNKNKLEEAEKVMEQAYKTEPKNTAIRDHYLEIIKHSKKNKTPPVTKEVKGPLL